MVGNGRATTRVPTHPQHRPRPYYTTMHVVHGCFAPACGGKGVYSRGGGWVDAGWGPLWSPVLPHIRLMPLPRKTYTCKDRKGRPYNDTGPVLPVIIVGARLARPAYRTYALHLQKHLQHLFHQLRDVKDGVRDWYMSGLECSNLALSGAGITRNDGSRVSHAFPRRGGAP